MRSLMSSLLNRAARRLSVIRCQCAGLQVACRTGAKARVYIPARCLIRNMPGKKAELAAKSATGGSAAVTAAPLIFRNGWVEAKRRARRQGQACQPERPVGFHQNRRQPPSPTTRKIGRAHV